MRRGSSHRPSPFGARKTGPSRLAQQRLALLDVLAQVDPHDAQGDLLRRRRGGPSSRSGVVFGSVEFLQDLELDGTLGQVGVLVDADAHGDDARVVVFHAVVGDGRLGGAAAVLRVDGVGEVPFYEGDARDQGDVVEVVDLGGWLGEAMVMGGWWWWELTVRWTSNLGWRWMLVL